jgi:hypothetical protein
MSLDTHIQMFAFQFVNYFCALFYIGFYLMDMSRLSGMLLSLSVTRQVRIEHQHHYDQYSHDRYIELSVGSTVSAWGCSQFSTMHRRTSKSTKVFALQHQTALAMGSLVPQLLFTHSNTALHCNSCCMAITTCITHCLHTSCMHAGIW